MEFLFGDRELRVEAGDLLRSPVEVIVCPADPELTLDGALAERIVAAAGLPLRREAEQLIREYGSIDPGMVVFTTAGDLPFKAVIHAVCPHAGEDTQTVIEQAVARSLQLCDMHGWHSVALPALGTEVFGVPIDVCARAFFRAITRFWDARHECVLEKVIVCLSEAQLEPFFHAFRDHAIEPSPPDAADEAATEPAVGHFELNEDDVSASEDPEIDSWFK
jgi:O-acetyl-ADP-ribose deacetylase (regulator of RNase III)